MIVNEDDLTVMLADRPVIPARDGMLGGWRS
jgi:hypothetical protein